MIGGCKNRAKIEESVLGRVAMWNLMVDLWVVTAFGVLKLRTTVNTLVNFDPRAMETQSPLGL